MFGINKMFNLVIQIYINYEGINIKGVNHNDRSGRC